MYGFKQAPRAWYEKLKSALETWGFVNSRADTQLFIFKRDKIIIIVFVYVDDILLIRNNTDLLSKVVTDLNKHFALKDLGELSYFLGFEATRSEKGMCLTHSKYAIDLLRKKTSFLSVLLVQLQ